MSKPEPRIKVYIHERGNENGCQFGWAENETMAPHQVRHECERSFDHWTEHVCSCGLLEVES